MRNLAVLTLGLALGALLPRARAEEASQGGLGLIEPSRDQSGVQLELSEGKLTVRNYYHRDIGFFVYRLDENGKPVETVVRNGYLGGVSGAASVVSVLQNAAQSLGTASSKGYVHLFDPKGNPLFTGFDPVPGDPIPLPVKPADAKSTTYRVLVLGPGAAARGPELTPEEQSHLTYVGFMNAFKVVNSIFGTMGAISANLKDHHQIGEYKDAFMTFYGIVVAARPSVAQLLASGKQEDAKAAAFAILNAITDQGTVRQGFVDLVVALSRPAINQAASNRAAVGAQIEAAAGKFRSLAKSVAAADALLAGTDLAIQVKEHVGANVVDEWKVKILPVRVSIGPGSLTFVGIPDDLPTFTCKATVEVPDGAFLVYEWRTTGKIGNLFDLGVAGQIAATFVTRSDKVRLVVDRDGEDTISCGVTLRTPGSPDLKLGSAKAVVTRLRPVTLTPERASVLATGDTVTFTADVTEPQKEKLTLRWTTPGALGTLDDGAGRSGTDITTDRATVTFRARNPEIGVKDEVSVQVRAGSKDVGSASAVLKGGLDVTIAPEPAFVTKNGDRFTLQATLSPVTTETLTYEWTTTGTLGVLSDALTGKSGAFVSTPSSSVAFETRSYAPEAIDTITLRVLRGQTLVGKATSQVRARTKLLDPEYACVLQAGDSVRFTAAPGGSYRWSCSGAMGTLEWSPTSNVATYVAKDVKFGQVDTVSVEIVAPDGTTSQATARISGLDHGGSVYAGTWTGTVTIIREIIVTFVHSEDGFTRLKSVHPILEVIPVTFTLRVVPGLNEPGPKVTLGHTFASVRPTPGLTTLEGETVVLFEHKNPTRYRTASFPANPSAPANVMDLDEQGVHDRGPLAVRISLGQHELGLEIWAESSQLSLSPDGKAMSARLAYQRNNDGNGLGRLNLPSTLKDHTAGGPHTREATRFKILAFDLHKTP